MELRRYLQVCTRYWWLVAIAFLVAGGVTVSRVRSREPVYESSATVVVRPRFVDSNQGARAVEALIRGVTINTTYAEIADSRLVRERAEDRLSPEVRRTPMSVETEVVTDTNIVAIRVKGPDATGARDLAAAISTETVSYVEMLVDLYRLEPLDPPRIAEGPSDARTPLTIAVGLTLGLMAGVSLALLAEYLREPPPRPAEGSTAALDDDQPLAPGGGDGKTPVEAGSAGPTQR
jgi:capsular polysaccharide biosynthesis protein